VQRQAKQQLEAARPGVASAKGSIFSSVSTGVWSDTSTSTVPSASAARNASRSRG